MGKRFDRAFYTRPTLEVAPELLGKFLVRQTADGIICGEINEVEAYMAASDPAAHGFTGQTSRNQALFGQPGTFYVYLIYGQYFCLNMVTELEGAGAAVLIRSIIPRDGLSNTLPRQTNGPGKVCKTFNIDLTYNAQDSVTSDELWLEDRGLTIEKYLTTPRVGISKATDKLWRFFYSPK